MKKDVKELIMKKDKILIYSILSIVIGIALAMAWITFLDTRTAIDLRIEEIKQKGEPISDYDKRIVESNRNGVTTLRSVEIFSSSLVTFGIPIILSLLFLLMYISFRNNKRPRVRKAIQEDFERLQIPSESKQFGEDFEEMFGDMSYRIPILLCFSISIILWIVVLFPHALEGLQEALIQRSTQAYIKSIWEGPAINYGFIGAYFYSLQMLCRRYIQADITPSTYMSICKRMIVSLTITLVLSLVLQNIGAQYVKMACFFVGIFPSFGLQWIEKQVNRVLGSGEKYFEELLPLRKIEGLTIWDEARLNEESIENVQHLATADIRSLIWNTRINTATLVDWIDQSILFIHLGGEKIKEFRDVGVRSATDLLDIYREDTNRAKLASIINGVTKEELEILSKSMERDPNIKHINSYWEKLA